jgi:hypothetical protein
MVAVVYKMKYRFISNKAKTTRTRGVVSDYADTVASRVSNEDKANEIRNISNLVRIGAWINPLSAINKIKTILKR